ncbi:14510_t:CDS:1, partial [Entrophospora sp. SA101]
ALRDSIKSNSEITSEYKNMQVVYSNHTKNTNKENAQLRHNNKELSNHIYRLIDEVKQLRSKIDTLKSCITDKDLLLGNFKDKIRSKSKEMKDFLSKIEALKTKLSSTQKSLSIKESEITTLRTELSALNSNLVSKNSELAHMENVLISKDDELKRMKDDLALKTSEIHSLESKLPLESVKIGGETDKKNIPNSADIFAVNKPIMNISKYLRKDIIYKNSKANMTKMPEVNSERSNLIGDTDSSYKDDTSQSIESMKNMNPEGNVSPQVEKKIDVPNSSLDKSNSVISMGGIEAIPAMTSVLGSPKIPWMMLSLLIIVVILLRFIRPILNANKKSENLKYAQIR